MPKDSDPSPELFPPHPDEGLKERHRKQLDEVMERFGRDFSVDPLLVASFHPDQISLFSTGFPNFDRANNARAVTERLGILADIRSSFEILGNPGKTELARTYQGWTSRMTAVIESNRQWADEELKKRQVALNQCVPFAHIKNGLLFTYVPEAYEAHKMGHLTDSDIEGALGVVPEEAPTGYELSMALREKGVYDDSRMLLEQRSLYLYGFAQFAASAIAISELHNMAAMGGTKAVWARATFERYRSRLFTDDPYPKAELLDLIGEQYKVYAHNEKNRDLSQFIESYSEGAFITAKDLRQMIGILPEIFEKYGYDVPTFLDNIERVPLPTLKSAEEITTERLHREAAALEAEITRVFGDINLTKAGRRHRGFAKLEDMVIKGGRTPSGDRIPKNLADGQEVNVLIALADLAQEFGGEIGWHGAEWLSACEHELRLRLDDLKQQAIAADLTVDESKEPAIMPFSEKLHSIEEKWPGLLMAAVRDMWPEAEGAIVAQRIDELLAYGALLAPPPAEVAHHMTREEALEGVTLRYLQDVIFPKGEKKRTVKEVQEITDRVVGNRDTSGETVEDVTVWDRVHDLVTVCNDEMFESAEFYETAPGEAIFGQRQGWFVAILTTHRGTRIIMAEHPKVGSATYVFPDTHENDPEPYGWKEVFTSFLRTDARELGAQFVIHSTKSPHGPEHVKKLLAKAREVDLAPLVFAPPADSSSS